MATAPASLPKAGGEGAFRCPFAASRRRQCRRDHQGDRRGLAGGRALRQGLSRARARQSRLSRAERGDARSVQDLHGRHRDPCATRSSPRCLGAKPEEAKPQLAPFWRSGLSFANMADNLAGVRNLFLKGGFAQVVHQESAGVEDSIAVRSRSRHRGACAAWKAHRRGRAQRGASRQARSLACLAEKRRANRRRHDLAAAPD